MVWQDGEVFEDRRDGVYFGQLAGDGRRKQGLGIRLVLNSKPNRDSKVSISDVVAVYEGNWVKNKREGKGFEVYENGDVYVGECVNDQK